MSKAQKYLFVTLVVSLLTVSASANSVSLGHVAALQNNGFTQVDLFANPGVTLHPTSSTRPFQNQLSLLVPFMGTIPSGAGNTLSISAVIMGSTFTQNFSIPAGTYSNFNQFVTFTFPNGIFHAVPVTLSVQLFSDGGRLLRSSAYSFNFVQTVPEPGTLLMVGSGVLAAVLRRRKNA
jgi:PEP-CTERM motif-containing protein